MNNDENVAASADPASDNLEEIEGIGPGYARALNKIGIYRFADLLQYDTPDELQQALEAAGQKIPLSKIENGNWLGQARDKVLAQQANGETPSPRKTAETAREPQRTSPKEDWEQHAGFNLFFDFKTDEQGKQEWLTRVYHFSDPHDDFDVKDEFSGVETAPWVNWILEQAKLPVAAQPIPTESEAAVPSKPLAPEKARIKILDVQIFKIGSFSDVTEKSLLAKVRFQLSGVGAKTLIENHISFRVEVHTINLESGDSNLVASGQGQLRPQVIEYTSRQRFPIPELGRYELHSIVLLLPPCEMMAYHRGPILRVNP